MTLVLAIDYGTTTTTAVVRSERGTAFVQFEDTGAVLPSCAAIAADGTMLSGAAAYRSAAADPTRFIPTPKRLLGGPPVIVGGVRHEPVDLVAATLAEVMRAYSSMWSSPPTHVVLTHPVCWSTSIVALAREAARRSGIVNPEMVVEPIAAARHYQAAAVIPSLPGSTFAVFDLGGGTLDVAVMGVEPNEVRVLATVGRTGAGEDFDVALTDYVLMSPLIESTTRRRLQTSTTYVDRRDRRILERSVKGAKERLSDVEHASVVAPAIPEVGLTRAELEAVIAEPVGCSLRVLEEAAANAGVSPSSLTAIYLSGGSCRTPLVRRLMLERWPGVRIEIAEDPKGVTAMGAAQGVELLTAGPALASRGTRRRRRSVAGALGALCSVAAAVTVVLTSFDRAEGDAAAEQVEPPQATASRATDPPLSEEPTSSVDPSADLHARLPVLDEVPCDITDAAALGVAWQETCSLTAPESGEDLVLIAMIYDETQTGVPYLDGLAMEPNVSIEQTDVWSVDGVDQGELALAHYADSDADMWCYVTTDYATPFVSVICGPSEAAAYEGWQLWA